MNTFSLQTQDALVAAGVCLRMATAVCLGTLPLLEGVSLRIRAALAVALTIVAAPMAWPAAAVQPAAGPVMVLAGEALVGLALGTAVAAILSVTGWAGGILGSVSGLSWADDFSSAGDPQSAGVARLAWWIGMAAFLAAGGQLAVVGGLVDSVRQIPVGGLGSAAVAGDALMDIAVAMPAAAIALALSLAIPALAAVLAFHLVAVFCLRAVTFSPDAGFLQGLAALVLLAALWLGMETWADGAASLMLGSVADCFTRR
jgi:flagellar biosynthetic protein FliR